MKRSVIIAAMLLIGAFAQPSWSASQTESQRINAFFDQVFERTLSRSPIRQSRLGVKTQQDRWDDISERHQLEDMALLREDLAKLAQFDFKQLDATAQLSYRLFERNSREALAAFAWRHHDYLVTQMGGLHRRVATTLLNDHPIADRADADAYIARLQGGEAADERTGRAVANSRQERGVQPPRFVYDLTLSESQNLLKGRPFEDAAHDSPVLADFRGKIQKAKFSASDQALLLDQAQVALREGFEPGYRALIGQLQAAQKSATDAAGVWKLPKGAEYYRFTLESYTTLPLAPADVHSLGVKEVARIHDEMRAVMKRVEFKGTLQEFFAHMRDDARYYYSDNAEGRAKYIADAQTLLQAAKERQREVVSRPPKASMSRCARWRRGERSHRRRRSTRTLLRTVRGPASSTSTFMT